MSASPQASDIAPPPTPGRIRLVDLRAQYRSIKPQIDHAIAGVLDAGEFVLGQQVTEFEREFASYCEVKHAVGVDSGTSALCLALLVAGVKPGDEVITVSFTFLATVAAIETIGALPVLVDVDPISLTMDWHQLSEAITRKTKAIVPVHLYGQAADMAPILDFGRRHGLVIIEDAAQAHGACYKGQRVGSLGDLGCFSFYPSKNLGAYGDAGAVTTSNDEYADKIRLLRNWGTERRYHHVVKGFNRRLDEIQAAILRVKLQALDAWTDSRRGNAAAYSTLLADLPVQLPVEMAYARHVFHIYAVRTPGRESLRRSLAEVGIETGIHYPLPVHLQPAYVDLGYQVGDFPVSERAASEVLSLPMYAELLPSDRARVADAIRDSVLAASPVP